MPASTIQRTETPESSQIHSYGYDATTQKLAVKFKSTPDRVYEYKNVSSEVAAQMDAADSKGSFIYRVIKPSYDFERMPEEQSETEGGATD